MMYNFDFMNKINFKKVTVFAVVFTAWSVYGSDDSELQDYKELEKKRESFESACERLDFISLNFVGEELLDEAYRDVEIKYNDLKNIVLREVEEAKKEYEKNWQRYADIKKRGLLGSRGHYYAVQLLTGSLHGQVSLLGALAKFKSVQQKSEKIYFQKKHAYHHHEKIAPKAFTEKLLKSLEMFTKKQI